MEPATQPRLRDAAVFGVAALLFLVQPLIAQRLLPALGGAPSVWLGTSLAFQVLLLTATAASTWLAQGSVLRARRFLVVSAAVSLGWMAWQSLQGAGPLQVVALPGGPPLAQVVGATLLMAGPPFLTLGVAGPLLQRGREGAFGRYALSSVGSLGGLLLGPLVLSRSLDLGGQSWLWAVGFAGAAALAPLCLPPRSAPATRVEAPAPFGAWVALAALGAALQLAITQQVTENVAPVPLLWVVPLSLYLGSYVVAFAAPAWATAERAGPLLVAGLLGVIEILAGHAGPLALQALAFGLLLWGGCLLCHGMLQQRRPPGEDLPRFALAVQLGGVLGSAAVSLAAPLVFRGHTELPLCLAILLALLAAPPRGRLLRVALGAAAAVDVGLRLREALTRVSLGPRWAELASLAVALALAVPLMRLARGYRVAALLLGGALAWDHLQDLGGSEAVRRNFFGIVRIDRWDAPDSKQARRLLVSGSIVHGVEWVDPDREAEPTAYFRPATAIGQLLRGPLGAQPGLSVGLLGLGSGTLASYAKAGDRFRFYEINPDMVWAARESFHFLARSRGTVEVVLGDGRQSLEHEAPQQFDLLVLDAFSGDAIPVHLLTVEAFALYLRHLAPNGIIAAHVTNTYVQLEPVLARLAATYHLHAVALTTPASGPLDLFTRWVVLAPERDLGELLPSARPLPSDGRPPWTDARVDLLGALR